MKKSIILISLGLLNLLHGMFHIIQFVQSMLLVAYSVEDSHDHSWVEEVMHSPVFAAVWAIIGVLTLVIGIRDYRHHKKCSHSGPTYSLGDLVKVISSEIEDSKNSFIVVGIRTYEIELEWIGCIEDSKPEWFNLKKVYKDV